MLHYPTPAEFLHNLSGSYGHGERSLGYPLVVHGRRHRGLRFRMGGALGAARLGKSATVPARPVRCSRGAFL
jgi:hypothetical protein